MKKAELISRLAEESGITKDQAANVLNTLGGVMLSQLKLGAKFTLPDIGVFSVGERAARTGRNPQTGEPIQIAASKTVKFKAAKNIRDNLNK